jgi:phosphatidylinositol alpha-1,6-mannosyltransferase
MNPVFFTRKFPPSVGGMETLAAGVWRSLVRARPASVLIAHGGANSRLPLWLPGALGRLLWLVLRRRVSFVLTGDALAFAIVSPFLRLLRVPHATMVMGLDITYSNPAYKALVLPPLRRASSVLAISAATASSAVAVGVPESRVTVIRLGVEVPAMASRVEARAALLAHLGLSSDARVLLTLGRLVPRKGALWFAREVLPLLDSSVHYVVAGDGPSRAALEAVGGNVHLLGRIDDDLRETVLRGADVFVQPNVAVPGDMEGFGLVTIEAALRGTPVVAADLEGLKDAVVHGETGLLLPSGDAALWASEVTRLLADPSLDALGLRFQAAAGNLYGETAMGDALVSALKLP